MLVFVVRRLLLGALVVLATAVAAFGGMRLLRPDRYVGDPWLSGTLHDLDRALLHLDFGDTCAYPDCPSIRNLWLHGLVVDVTLLGGALLLGALAGSAAGRWCAGRRGTAVARGLEAAAMLFYCAPSYIVAYVALLLFDPFFGVLPVRLLVDPNRFGEPFATVPDFVRGMALPWLIAAAPVAAACLRLTLAMTAEAADEDYLRTALAKGVDPRTAVRRHAGPAARASVASYVGAAIPTILLNVVLVEFVFSLPGFFKQTWRALGKAPGLPSDIDYAMLQAVAIWAAVLITVVGVLADIALTPLDPRVRAAGRVG